MAGTRLCAAVHTNNLHKSLTSSCAQQNAAGFDATNMRCAPAERTGKAAQAAATATTVPGNLRSFACLTAGALLHRPGKAAGPDP
jgi:hypothetical protein